MFKEEVVLVGVVVWGGKEETVFLYFDYIGCLTYVRRALHFLVSSLLLLLIVCDLARW